MLKIANFNFSKKYIITFLVLVFFVLLFLIYFFGSNYYHKKQLWQVLPIITENKATNIENCGVILNFNKNKFLNNSYFNEESFDRYFLECDKKFNLEYLSVDLENCIDLIKKPRTFYSERYVNISSLNSKKEECSIKYLNPKFSIGRFFDIENDFKTSIVLDFELDFFEDVWSSDSKEFIENRIEAKNRLKNLISFEWDINLEIDDIYIYQNRAILNANLLPQTKYNLLLKSFDTSIWEKTNEVVFSFETPENKYFWLRLNNKVSVFTKNNLPEFSLLDYNTSKTNTKISLCRVSEETYAKVENLHKTSNSEFSKDFILNDFSSLETFECSEKNINFKESKDIDQNKIVNRKIKFSDFVTENDPKWLYVLNFVNDEDLFYNSRLNKPLFFSVVNSHVMMKTSKSWETFVFVNDFDWNPLYNQEITLYLNDFEEFASSYNFRTYNYEINSYNDFIKQNILSDWIKIWKTDENWVLKINLKDTIDDFFDRTFEDSWYYDFSWLYKSFFVKSSWENHLSYLVSTWNSWILPWNFWYSVDYFNSNDEIFLQRWSDDRWYNAHFYTDRRLYLPWEDVYLKWIIRKNSDLSIPDSNVNFDLIISDPLWKEILNEEFNLNDFWSFSRTLNLKNDSPLWTYNVFISSNDTRVYYTNFQVEVFKNPKFENIVTLTTDLKNWNYVDIKQIVNFVWDYYSYQNYKWSFKINWSVTSKYFNWNLITSKDFEYKVYRQFHYDNDFWNDCYYGCYWEPQKEFYTEWKWKIDENWIWKFEIDVDFSSSYNDYKYIVEITVTDDAGDTITWSNTILTKLPDEYKKYNSSNWIIFNVDSKFSKVWWTININWKMSSWVFDKNYNDKYLFIIKRKNYINKQIIDVNWYPRNINQIEEILEDVFFVNDNNFKLNKDWTLSLDYKLDKNAEYVFEYWLVNNYNISHHLWKQDWFKLSFDEIKNIVNEFKYKKDINLINIFEKENCTENCIEYRTLNVWSIISSPKSYFSVVTYDETKANNPIENDNKLRVISEKVSYNLWEKAKILVRLPITDSKLLITTEKDWVVNYEYVNVKWNVFFKEFIVDDSFYPNAYIWVFMVDTQNKINPEYKVWYTEIIVDKTDKKSFIDIKSNKKTYEPREEVTLEIEVKNKDKKAVESELTVMVVDDSLISLMWNVDLNTLEKIFVKLPFTIQTSITNIAMLKNYYFSRMWIVWWSWAWSFKWWDSAVSTRNIFKNTAYYNPEVITDKNGKAKISFTLPDNLTNFRVMVVWNSKNNFFWYSEEIIEVRKNVMLEDKTPMILRHLDKSTIWANIFNNTSNDIDFKVWLETKWWYNFSDTKNIKISSFENKFISWDIEVINSVDDINYTISALWNTSQNSDKIEWKIQIKESPVLVTNLINSWLIEWNSTKNISQNIPVNTDFENTQVDLYLSNNKLSWIEKIVKTLSVYPYWCIEQTTSATIPNVVIKNYESLFSWIWQDLEIDKKIRSWIEKITSMQWTDWWFKYWQGNWSSDLTITPYVLRSLVFMRKSWVEIEDSLIENAKKYLKENLKNNSNNVQISEILWALNYAWEKVNYELNPKDLDRHSLIAYTYSLILSNWDKTKIESNIELIKQKLNENNNDLLYWDNNSDRAIFASILIDYSFEKYKSDINDLVFDLYSLDWDSYYYSTQTKNNAFIAFYKYLEKTNLNNVSYYSYDLWNISNNNLNTLWWIKKSLVLDKYILKDVITEENNILNFDLKNKWSTDIFYDLIVRQYPKNKEEVKEYSSWMKIKREIFEITNMSLFNKCSNAYDYELQNLNCNRAFSLVKNNIFKKWELYKTKITVTFNDNSPKRNLTIEDYLPWSFRVINSKFKTESSSVTQSANNWNWSYIEYNSDVVMANSEYVWRNENVLEYFFRPEFSWTYTLPPVTWYLMYNPIIRANTKFSTIEVK